MIGGDDGARTRGLSRDRTTKGCNYLKLDVLAGINWNYKARSVSVIVPSLYADRGNVSLPSAELLLPLLAASRIKKLEKVNGSVAPLREG